MYYLLTMVVTEELLPYNKLINFYSNGHQMDIMCLLKEIGLLLNESIDWKLSFHKLLQ